MGKWFNVRLRGVYGSEYFGHVAKGEKKSINRKTQAAGYEY